MTENRDQLLIDQVIDALGDPRRRQVIGYLHGSGEENFHFDDIAQRIIPRETESDPAHVRIDLHHRQFPKLEEAGLIEYDARHGDVRYRGLPHDDIDLSTFLDATEDVADNHHDSVC